MQLSSFGEKLAGQSGIVELMTDVVQRGVALIAEEVRAAYEN